MKQHQILSLKKHEKLQKTLILDIYVGNKDISSIKAKYKRMDYFADFKIITPNNYTSELASLLDISRIDYLHKNFQIFMTEYQYWYSCMKLKKILFNEKENITFTNFELDTETFVLKQKTYMDTLNNYAKNVLNQEGL